MPMEYRIIRALTCYSNSDERLVFDVQLQGFDLAKLQREFHVESGNPMYDSYEVTIKNVPFLKSYLPAVVGINWDFTRYGYYVEAVEN